MSKEEFINLTKIMFEEQKIKEEMDKLQEQNKELVLENMALLARLDELSLKLQKKEEPGEESEEEEIDFDNFIIEEEEKLRFAIKFVHVLLIKLAVDKKSCGFL